MAITLLLSSEFESYFVSHFQSFCFAMYPTGILLGGSSQMQDDCILINLEFCFICFVFIFVLFCFVFNMFVTWSIWGQVCCTSQGISLFLPLLFPSDGIHWFSVKGCTESHNECFKRIVKYYKLYSTHCCHRTLCNIWASSPYPNHLTDKSVSKPGVVITRWQLPSIGPL